MDRTERLLALLDALRRRRTPVTAEALAKQEGVSVRTIYRDIQTLIGLGAPIEGEAGLGYILKTGFFMPPLLFSPSELEALVLGARWVQTLPDGELGEAARNALAKIATASPEDLRSRIEDAGLWPVNIAATKETMPVLERAREAMRSERAAEIDYSDADGNETTRVIWPIQLAYWEGKQILVGWCCLREDYRLFRTDRITNFRITELPYGRPRAAMSREWFEAWEKSRNEHAPTDPALNRSK